MLPQHPFICIGIIAHITQIIILIVVLLTITAVRMVGGGVEVDVTTRTEVTAIVTRCMMAVGQDAVREMKGGMSQHISRGDWLVDGWEAIEGFSKDGGEMMAR